LAENETIRALVVEDDPDMALQLKLLLKRKFSAQVETAGDCASAREKMSAAPFDFITLDYKLPDGEGLALLEEITAMENHPPVIMVTGRGGEETAVWSFRLKASGYVVKDARLPDMLNEAVEKALAEVALTRAERELAGYREHLEELVKERTAALKEANAQLQSEIARRRRIEEDLRKLNIELDGYSSMVSHDLRAPLTAIRLANETLQKLVRRTDLEDIDPEITRFGEVIEISSNRAEALIEDLLALARAGQKPENISDVDVSEVVRGVLEERAENIKEKGVEVRADENLGHVSADFTHLYQVFSNLIGNAIKHNTGKKPRVDVSYLGEDEGGCHRYLIKDNGAGIPPGDIENVFLPFFRGENGETGIGLSTAEKIIKVYDGEIRVYNDSGACFEFVLRDFKES